MMQIPEKYSKYFNERQFWQKLKKLSGKLGSRMLYYLIVLYEMMKDKRIPVKTRLLFVAALGYFILPSDLVADFLPALGYTDDLAFLTYAMASATDYMTPEIREKARKKVDQLLKRKPEDEHKEED
ncbi:MAG: YkvA family protein [bacterium]|jgi:uncharacterized membrane protein YkvA (DUF1232 family)